jgi:hypothetical protein
VGFPYCNRGHFSSYYPDFSAHFKCLSKAFEENPSCPICREQIIDYTAIQRVVSKAIQLFHEIKLNHHNLNIFFSDIDVCVNRIVLSDNIDDVTGVFYRTVDSITNQFSNIGRFSVALLAPIHNGLFLKFAGEYQKIPAFVYAAVTQNGLALKYASSELQDALHIVYAALRQNPLALEYASERLRNNFDLVLFAVKINGFALFYASDDLQRDLRILEAAFDQNHEVRQYIPEDLLFDVIDNHRSKSQGAKRPFCEDPPPKKWVWSISQQVLTR